MNHSQAQHSRDHGGVVADASVAAAAPAQTGPIPVIYIAGAGRSGSTLLGDVLAMVPGFAHAGELRYAWQRGFLDNRHCACARPFSECDFWSDVRNAVADAGGVTAKPENLDESVRSVITGMGYQTRIRALAGRAGTVGQAKPSTEAEAAATAAAVDEIHRLYDAFRLVSGCHTIIDSSKLPTYGRLLASDDRFHVHVVHLVRDPRGVVFSWGRVKAAPDAPGAKMLQMPPSKASGLWMLWNALSLKWWHGQPDYTLIRYEDFVADPQLAIDTILRAVGHEPHSVLAAPQTVNVGANYGIAGNPDRFERSARKLRLDTRWKEEITPWAKTLTTTLTAPLLRRFRYPILP